MVHEMIHYYLAYTGKDVKMKHGEEFKKMASKLNHKYGLNITTTIDSTPYEKKPSFTLGYLISSIFY
jgi:predicted SprT family Zn-dependent metalloprotease